jgi:hypothetical protein
LILSALITDNCRKRLIVRADAGTRLASQPAGADFAPIAHVGQMQQPSPD